MSPTEVLGFVREHRDPLLALALLVGFGGGMAGLGGPISARHGWAYGVHTRFLVAFALDGNAALPKEPPPTVPVPLRAEFAVDPALAGTGALVYGR